MNKIEIHKLGDFIFQKMRDIITVIHYSYSDKDLFAQALADALANIVALYMREEVDVELQDNFLKEFCIFVKETIKEQEKQDGKAH